MLKTTLEDILKDSLKDMRMVIGRHHQIGVLPLSCGLPEPGDLTNIANQKIINQG